MIVVYHPPPTQKNKLSANKFFDEFSVLLEDRILSSERLCIAGGFNFHMVNMTSKNAEKF